MLGRKHKILVVDDDELFGHRTVELLTKAGFEASFHRGPIGTLQAVRDSQCELVILDVNMPRINGAQVLRMIRDSFGLGQVRVILCTNMEPRVIDSLSRMSGVPAVAKSCSAAEFIDRISGMFQTSGVIPKVSVRRAIRG